MNLLPIDCMLMGFLMIGSPFIFFVVLSWISGGLKDVVTTSMGSTVVLKFWAMLGPPLSKWPSPLERPLISIGTLWKLANMRALINCSDLLDAKWASLAYGDAFFWRCVCLTWFNCDVAAASSLGGFLEHRSRCSFRKTWFCNSLKGVRETLNSSHTLHRTSFLCFHKPFRLDQVTVVWQESLGFETTAFS